MMNRFHDLTQPAEEMIRHVLSSSKTIAVGDVRVREKLARTVLEAWRSAVRALAPSPVSPDFDANFNAEYDRLDELIVELAAAIPAAATQEKNHD